MRMAIPPKPEDATWTDDQWKAIMAKGQDILVAAAGRIRENGCFS